MKSDARFLLNRKKWKNSNSASSYKTENWRNSNLKSHGAVDARKILNLKRSKKSQAPVLGTYMRTKTASALIASQIRKEIIPKIKVPEKRVHLSSDGNLIITSKSKKLPQMSVRKETPFKMMYNKLPQDTMQWEPSTSDADDLEHTALEDLLDLDSLPPAYVSPKVAQSTNLSRRSAIDNILEMKNTMVADELAESDPEPLSVKLYVSNLRPSVSMEDLMELFGNIGDITNVEMLMPGTAVIHFCDKTEAKKAMDIYQNRLLDGLPMRCFLKMEHNPQKTGIAQRLGNRIVSPPPQKTLSKSVAANPRSRYNPRNVQFTVKLT